MENSNISHIKFLTGNQIPQIGLGTYSLKGQKCQEIIKSAIGIYGYRLLDTAILYENQKDIGDALKDLFNKTSITRGQIFITSKIPWWMQGYENALKAADQIFYELGLEYIDLLLVHYPRVDGVDGVDQTCQKTADIRMGTWRAMEKLKEEGKVRDIGVSNYTVTHLKHLLENCKFKPVVNQIEIHPLGFDTETIEYCKKNDIVVEGFSPLAKSKTGLLEMEVINRIAKKYGKTPAQVCLKWSVQQGFVTIPRTDIEKELKENIELFGWEMEENDLMEISGLNKNLRLCPDPNEVLY